MGKINKSNKKCIIKEHITKNKKMVPTLVKWAGGKKQLLKQIEEFLPSRIENYIEPFVGGGAVAFFILKKYSVKNVFISDINKELVKAYQQIKKNPKPLIKKLKEHKENHCKEYYYKVRSYDVNSLTDLELIARFIYLNKTCFNGLYRVNSKGGFNVPMGDYKNPCVCSEEDLNEISNLLKNTTIKKMNFKEVLKYAKKGDFIYFDPPYHPLENSKSFTTYTKNNFIESDQRDLANVFQTLDKRGCKVMLSNSDTPLIKELYKKYNIHVLKATRRINSNAKGRGKINEFLITNYDSGSGKPKTTNGSSSKK